MACQSKRHKSKGTYENHTSGKAKVITKSSVTTQLKASHHQWYTQNKCVLSSSQLKRVNEENVGTSLQVTLKYLDEADTEGMMTWYVSRNKRFTWHSAGCWEAGQEACCLY